MASDHDPREANQGSGEGRVPAESWVTVVDPESGERWRIDAGFMQSGWRCQWADPAEGNGCLGIGPVPDREAAAGCCSVGAELIDEEEARSVVALAATLDPSRFQHHEVEPLVEVIDRHSDGEGQERTRWRTRVVDGACVFSNRPGFAGGVGCALHLAGLEEVAATGDREVLFDWKPSVCWQLPFRVERQPGVPVTLRRWKRSDWGAEDKSGDSVDTAGSGGAADEAADSVEAMAWWCTEEAAAFDASSLVVERLAPELRALLGEALFARLESVTARLDSPKNPPG